MSSGWRSEDMSCMVRRKKHYPLHYPYITPYNMLSSLFHSPLSIPLHHPLHHTVYISSRLLLSFYIKGAIQLQNIVTEKYDAIHPHRVRACKVQNTTCQSKTRLYKTLQGWRWRSGPNHQQRCTLAQQQWTCK